MKKIMVIGQDGMLGSELFERLSKNSEYEVFGTTLATLDITNEIEVCDKIKEIDPYYVINCAAYTNVDGCETNFELANLVNGISVGNIAKGANFVNARLIQISTDYVFDGELPVENAYTEDMQTGPVSAYGKTKLLGEQMAKKADKYYILRTAWLYGKGNNFVRTMINLSKTKDSLSVVSDQHGSPTSVTTLCEIIEQIMIKEPECGIYHSTNEGFTTWYEFAKKIFEICNIQIPLKPVTSDEFPTPTKRPHNSKLSKQKLNKIGIYPKNYIEALEEYLKGENI